MVLRKVDQVIAWLLLALFFVMTLSGYMLTKGFIDRYWGFLAHFQFAIPTMALFTIHFSVRLRFILIKWTKKDAAFVSLISLMVGAALFLPILYLDLFFHMG